MNPATTEIGGLPVLSSSLIDGRHQSTGHCSHIGPEGEIGTAAGLAICGSPGEGFYLFRCDRDWRPVADTWHATAEEAMRQAEFEYEGVSRTWQHHG